MSNSNTVANDDTEMARAAAQACARGFVVLRGFGSLGFGAQRSICCCLRSASAAGSGSWITTPSARPAGARSISSGRQCATGSDCRSPSIPAASRFRRPPSRIRRITIVPGQSPASTGSCRCSFTGSNFTIVITRGGCFGRWLADAGREVLAEADLLVPVPLARWRLLARRFNQAQILAAEAGRRTGKPVNPFALVTNPFDATSNRPHPGSAAAGMWLAFSVFLPSELPKISGKAIVLVDDVITSGATASAAARALKRAGARKVDVLALAIVSERYS